MPIKSIQIQINLTLNFANNINFCYQTRDETGMLCSSLKNWSYLDLPKPSLSQAYWNYSRNIIFVPLRTCMIQAGSPTKLFYPMSRSIYPCNSRTLLWDSSKHIGNQVSVKLPNPCKFIFFLIYKCWDCIFNLTFITFFRVLKIWTC